MRILRLLLVLVAGVTLLTPVFAQQTTKKVAVEETNTPEINVIDNKLYVKNAPVGSHLEVITIVGNKVKDIEMKTVEGVYELNLPKGIYIFRLEGVVRKFVIK